EVGSAIVGHCADSQRRHSDSTDKRTREHGWSSHLSLLKWCRKQQGSMLSDWCSPGATAALIRRNETAGLEAPASRDVRHKPPLNRGGVAERPDGRTTVVKLQRPSPAS